MELSITSISSGKWMLRCSGPSAVGETSSEIETENTGWYPQFDSHIKDCFSCEFFRLWKPWVVLRIEADSTSIQKNTLKSAREEISQKCWVIVKRTTGNRSSVEGCWCEITTQILVFWRILWLEAEVNHLSFQIDCDWKICSTTLTSKLKGDKKYRSPGKFLISLGKEAG